MSNTLFYFQFGISFFGLAVTGALLFADRQNQNIFLPIFTSIIFAWIPSPLTSSTKNNTITNDENMNKTQVQKKQVTIDDVMPRQQNIV